MDHVDYQNLRPARGLSHVITTLAAASCLLCAGTLAAQEVNLRWLPAGVESKLGSYRPNPQPIRLSETKPATLKKAPEDIKAPLYGELKIGPKDAPAPLLVLLDETDGKAPRLFLDANRNGNLTDDAAVTLEEQPSAAAVRETTIYSGNVTVRIPYADGARDARLVFTRYGKTASNPAAFREMLFYSRDYAWAGDVKLGGKSFSAMLLDEAATGDFRAAQGKSSNVRFLIDVDGDGRFDPRRENLDARDPFNVGGTTYEIAEMKADGRFRIVKSSKVAEELTPAPNLAKGGKAPAFTARATDGKEVKFPDDYKGKVVLLDFWATWCPPCVREVPNVVANYEKYHDKGFEILAVSLDRPNDEEKLAKFVKEHKMPWPQIFDTKGGPQRIAQNYNVLSIPFMLIVDGDTGEVLAGADARGPNLGPAIESALSKKGTPKKAGR